MAASGNYSKGRLYSLNTPNVYSEPYNRDVTSLAFDDYVYVRSYVHTANQETTFGHIYSKHKHISVLHLDVGNVFP